MCGRYTLDTNLLSLSERFNLRPGVEYRSSREVFPGSNIYCFDKSRSLELKHWGIKVDFLKKEIINSRIEKIYESNFFRSDFENRRIIVPATGFFEWDKSSPTNDRYLVTTDEKIFGLAAIWRISGLSLLTKEASGDLTKIHHREPVILPESLEKEYLASNDPKGLHAKLLEIHPSYQLENLEDRQQLELNINA